MKKIFSLLMIVFSTVAFAQVMTVSVNDDSWEVCPTDVVDVSASHTTPANNAIETNGTSTYLEIPFSTYTSFGLVDFSVEFWVSLNSLSQKTYLAYNKNNTNVGWAIYVDQQGFVGFEADDVSGGNNDMTGTSTDINDATWHHVALTWDRGTTTASLYIDGGFEVAKPMSLGDITSNAPTYLGYGLNASSPVYANADFDEYRVWSQVRLPGQISTNYDRYVPPSSEADLVQYFDFNEVVSTNGWEDCVEGVIAPAGTSAPVIDPSAGPYMQPFNFQFTWSSLVTGQTQSGSNFQETFDANDTIVVSTGWCKYESSDTLVVTVLDCDTTKDPRDVAAVYAPTAFTPNGDEKNDVYIVKANAISYFEMQVYNRLGNILFYSKDINTGWDGTFEEGTCYEGVYAAKIIYRDLEGIEHVKYQQFLLMR